jgi:raffinose/stachyose/melibiose transport system permease protein
MGIVIAFGLFDYIGRRFHTSVAAFLRATYFLPQIIPVVIAGLVWGYIFVPDGSLNAFLEAVGLEGLKSDWLGHPSLALPSLMVVLVWVQVGYAVVVFMAGLGRVEPELYEAAEIDGAGFFWRFRAIAIPHIRPELFVVTLISTVAALKVFGPVYSLTRGGPGNATFVPSYYSYQTFFQRLQVGYGAAMSVVLAVLVVIVAALILYFQSRSQARDDT